MEGERKIRTAKREGGRRILFLTLPLSQIKGYTDLGRRMMRKGEGIV